MRIGKVLTTLFVLVVILSKAGIAMGTIASPYKVLGDSNRTPIIIIGDNDFTSENGVIAGSGTRDDPYIIANWVIMANESTPYGSAGIFIANTTKYFVIRNVTVFGGDFGIVLDNVSNFVVENTEIYNISNIAILVGGNLEDVFGGRGRAFNGIIQKNKVYSSDTFVLAGGSNITIEGNLIHDLYVKSGIWVEGIIISANNSIIKNNVVHGIHVIHGINERHYGIGILVINAGNVSIYNNTVSNMTTPDFGVHGIATASVSNVRISNNTIRDIDDNGISIFGGSKNIHIENNWIKNCKNRNILIYFNNENVTIKGNILENARDISSIGIEQSSSVHIIENEVYGSDNKGIHILDSSEINIVNNTIYNNLQGVWIEQGSKNIYLESNNLSSNQQGMVILYSKNITMRSNVFENNMYSLGIWAGTDVSGYIHDIDTSNMINGRPIYYWINKSNEVVPVNSSFLGLINCRNITAANLNLSHEGRILIVNSSNITVRDSKLENDEYAVDIVLSKKVLFENVSIFNTGETAVTLIQTYDSSIKDTIINDANTGIYLGDSTSIFVTNVSLSSIRGWRGVAVVNGEDISISGSRLENIENEWSISADNSYNVLISQNHIGNSKAGILSYNSTNVHIANNRVTNITSWPGIEVVIGSKNVTIRGNTLYSLNPDSISMHDCYDIAVKDNLINRSNGQGIHIYRAGDVLLENNSVSNVGETGILVKDNSYNITITDSDVYNSTGGIALISSSNISILNSSIHDNGFPRNWSGIYMRNATNVRIIGSFICHNAFAGIVLNEASDALIQDSEVCNNVFASGIELYYGSHAIITNTAVYRNAHAGIWIIHTNTFAVIENSTVYGNAWRGIEFHDGGSGILTDSLVFNNTIDGIYVANTSGVTVNNSILSENGACGIAIDYSKNVVLSGNLISSNKYDGIVSWNSTLVIIKNNTIDNNTLKGISLRSIRKFMIMRNFISKNRNDGVFIGANSSGGIITGNNITRNTGKGIYFENSMNNTIYLNSFIDNGQNAYVDLNSSNNTFYSPEPITYVFINNTFIKHLGNYWDDYIGADKDKDGIGDTPYEISKDNMDLYPLITKPYDYIIFQGRKESFPIGKYSSVVSNASKVIFVFNNLGTVDAFSTSQYIGRTIPISIRTVTRLSSEIGLNEIKENDVVISVGGPLVNRITSIYDGIAPVHMVVEGKTITIVTPQGNVTWSAPKPWWNVTKGYFIIQGFFDHSLNASVFTIYGTDADSTAAGAYYFMSQVYPNLSTYTNVSYIVGLWQDTEPGADVPLPGADLGDTSGFSAGDSITIVAQG